jgi:hypothetical protein
MESVDPRVVSEEAYLAAEAEAIPPVPPLLERLLGVILAPFETFRLHHGAWGWAAPWLIVSALGVLAGVATVANGQLEGIVERQVERQQEELERRGIEINAEGLEFQRKLGIFFAKVGSMVGPPLGLLWSMFMFGTVAFVAVLVWGEPEAVDLMRCLSLAAWCSLGRGVGYVALTLAASAGSPMPATSLVHAVDGQSSPLLSALLGRVDPVVIYYYVLFAVGLRGSCRLSARNGAFVAGGCYLGVSLLQLGMGLMAMSKGSP